MFEINSAVCRGISPFLVKIESYIKPSRSEDIKIYGLASIGMKEGNVRIMAALRSAGVLINGQAIINLFPARAKKEGSSLDVAIAISIAQSTFTDIDPKIIKKSLFIGELSLSGDIRPCGIEEIVALGGIEGGFDTLFISSESRLSMHIPGLIIIKVGNLLDLIDIIRKKKSIPVNSIEIDSPLKNAPIKYDIDFSEVLGLEHIKRAMQVIAAGRHHSILMGPRGCGKTMVANRLLTILPPLSEKEMGECMRLSAASGGKSSFNFRRPFREVHHSISPTGLVGGGSEIKPGEISLSHNGILFLDELTEFHRSLLDLLRQPLETHSITISRTLESITYPSDFLFIGAFNPCPCGLLSITKNKCVCSPYTISHYLSRLSSALIDRIDIQLVLTQESHSIGAKVDACMSSEEMVEGIRHSWDIQKTRGVMNSNLEGSILQENCKLDEECLELLNTLKEENNMSNRGITKILRISRTIADIERSPAIKVNHLKEAASYRALDTILGRLSLNGSRL